MPENIEIGPLSISEADREFTVNVEDRGDFTVRIPLPYEEATVAQMIARSMGGIDIKSYPPEEYENIRMLMTLNFVICKSPPWWKDASRCPDAALLQRLWGFYLSSKDAFQERLKKNNFTKRLEVAPASR